MQFEEDDEDEAWLLSAALEADAAVAVVSAERWTCSVCTTSGNTAGANCQSCGAAAPRLVRPAAATPAAGLRAFFAPQEAPEEQAASLPPLDADGLADCPTATEGMRVDALAAQTFTFPAQTEQRAYQLAIARTALFSNTLVCLPTGLGKTLIAAVVMHAYYRWFPKGKVVFLAPTRPLVVQQAEACRHTVGIPVRDMCELTGATRKDDDGRRSSAWASHRVFFATPQTFANDLETGVCPARAVVCLVLDEAHRATGNYAYVTAVRRLVDAGVKFRVLALSATPGTTREAVQTMLSNMRISAVEFRGEDHPDVAQYTHSRSVELVVVKATTVMAEVQSLYVASFSPLVSELIAMRVVHGAADEPHLLSGHYAFVKAAQALSASAEMHAALGPRLGRAHFLLQRCQKLARGLDMLQTTGVRPALEYLTACKAQEWARQSRPLEEALRLMSSAVAGGEAHAPKLQALSALVRQHFASASARHSQGMTRAIVFTSSRESVKHVLEELAHLTGAGVLASAFIGQGDSASRANRADKSKGQTQAEQAAVLSAFRSGKMNVLVATCIGEEGLDVPRVDLVVFMDSVGGVRLVQRMGRTGRSCDGRVIALLAEGKEVASWHAKQSESQRMAKLLATAEHVFQLDRNGSRMLPYRCKPRLQLVTVAPQEAREMDRGGSGGGGACAAPTMKRAPAAKRPRRERNLLAEMMSDDSRSSGEEEEEFGVAPPRSCAGPRFLSLSDSDASEAALDRAEEDGQGEGDAWAMPTGEDRQPLFPLDDVVLLQPSHPHLAMLAPGQLSFAACVAGAPRAAAALLPGGTHCQPRGLFDASSRLHFQPGGRVVTLPPPPPPPPLQPLADEAPALASAQAPCGATPTAAAAVDVIDLTGDDEGDGYAPRSQRLGTRKSPRLSAPPIPARAASRRSPLPPPVETEEAREPPDSQRERELQLSMPPPPARPASTRRDSNPSQRPPSGAPARFVTPIPHLSACATPPEALLEAASPMAMPAPPVGEDAPPSSGLVVHARRRVRAPPAARTSTSSGHRGAAAEEAAPARRRRLVRKRSLDAAAAARAEEVEPEAERPRPRGGRRGGGASRFFEAEAAQASDEEGSGDEAEEDEETGDDSFITHGTAEPEAGQGSGGGAQGAPAGLALYRQLMITPDSGAGAGPFARPAFRPAAFRLADLRSFPRVLDSQSPDGAPGDAHAREEREDEDEGDDDVETCDTGAGDGGRNEDMCRACRDGGDLLCCDGCPAAFHPLCVGLHSVPLGDSWFCPDCSAQQAAALGIDFADDVYGDSFEDDGCAAGGDTAEEKGAEAVPRESGYDDSDDDDAPRFDLGLF